VESEKEMIERLAESVARLEQTLDRVLPMIEKATKHAESLENVATVWANAKGGLWVVKKILTVIIFLGGVVIAIQHFFDVFNK